MTEENPKEAFLSSLRRCSATEEFIPAFYERFLASSDEIRLRFRFTDFVQQNKMLLRSLQVSAAATSGDPEALREINEIAKSHDRYHRNIEPHLYDLWLDAAIATASEFDQQWNESVEAAWRRILGHVIQRMIRKY